MNDLIDVKNDIAKDVKLKWEMKMFPKDEILKLGNASFRASDIKLIILDEEIKENDAFIEKVKEYYDKRRELLRLSPLERARKNAWGHFGLFFFAFNQRYPVENEIHNGISLTKDNIYAATVNWHESNPGWILPSAKVWLKFLGYEGKKIPASYIGGSGVVRAKELSPSATWRYLENCEAQQLQDIERERVYQENVSQEHEQFLVKTVSDKSGWVDISVNPLENEIDVSKLPF